MPEQSSDKAERKRRRKSHSRETSKERKARRKSRRERSSSEARKSKKVRNQCDIYVEDARGQYTRDSAKEDRSWRYRQHDHEERRSVSPALDTREESRRRRRHEGSRERENPIQESSREEREAEEWFKSKRKAIENVDITKLKSGGAYIPPAKLKQLQQQIEDKSSEEFQRISWNLLKKRIMGKVNKINVGNIHEVVFELFHENVVRGKGLLARSIIQAQAFSPTYTNVYAALVAVINSKFPHIGELVIRRLIIQFKRAFRRNDKASTINASKFLAHLVNQDVVHEILALEVLILLLEKPTDDSVEVAIAFLKECGQKLTEQCPRGVHDIFERLRSILHESEIGARVEYMIEVMFSVRKDKFAAHPAVVKELDLIEEEDQITHTVGLDDAQDPENMLNVFQFDPEFEKNEEMYEEIKKDILGEGSDGSGDEDEGSEGDGDEEGAEGGETTMIVDKTATNITGFRRTVYLTIQSSLDFQECVHKLMKLDIKPGMEIELCHMLVDCCAQQRTYERFYGLTTERFCRLKKEYKEQFQEIFKGVYETIHRFELKKLRNVARMFAHLLHTDAISWEVLSCIKLNEDDTTSPGRIFIKVLFLELAEFMGLATLLERIRDATLQTAFDGLFPRDNPRDTRFSINFFTAIGLGGLTVDLREHLTSGPAQDSKMDDENESSSDESSDAEESESDSDSSSSEESESAKRIEDKRRMNDESDRRNAHRTGPPDRRREERPRRHHSPSPKRRQSENTRRNRRSRSVSNHRRDKRR